MLPPCRKPGIISIFCLFYMHVEENPYSTFMLLLLLLYFPLGYPKGNGPKARGSPGEKEMKTIVKNEDEW